MFIKLPNACVYYASARALLTEIRQRIIRLKKAGKESQADLLDFAYAVDDELRRFCDEACDKLEKEDYAFLILSHNNIYYSITVYRMPSGRFELVSYRC
jgi:hypothetical protein